MLLNRLFVFVFGGYFWIYGYVCLYLYYGVILGWVMTKKRFPFEDSFNDVNLSKGFAPVTNIDVSKVPETLLAVLTTVFAVIFAALYVTKPSKVPLPSFVIDDYAYPFYIIGVLAIIILITFLLLIVSFRLFIRKKNKIEPRVRFYFKSRHCDSYWIFVTLSLIANCIIGLLAYWVTTYASFFYEFFLISVYFILFMNAYLHYIANDYHLC
jgi:amino acid transporter